jgi:hypothetical protein
MDASARKALFKDGLAAYKQLTEAEKAELEPLAKAATAAHRAGGLAFGRRRVRRLGLKASANPLHGQLQEHVKRGNPEVPFDGLEGLESRSAQVLT